MNNNNPKIIQTDEKNRKVWLITKSVVPLTEKESQVLNFGLTRFVEKKMKLVYYEDRCGIS